MIEACKRDDNPHCEREEYCLAEAADRYGPALDAGEQIDAILYDFSNEPTGLRDSFRAQYSTHEGSVVEGVFAFYQYDEAGRMPIKREVYLAHQRDNRTGCDSYIVESKWSVNHGQHATGMHISRYFVDIYPHGDVQAEVEQPDLITGQWEQSDMTPYDYQQLLSGLLELEQSAITSRPDTVH